MEGADRFDHVLAKSAHLRKRVEHLEAELRALRSASKIRRTQRGGGPTAPQKRSH